MTIDELIADIESLVPCVEGLPTALCQTGEEYLVFRSHGPVDVPGYVFTPVVFDTEERAVSELHRHIVAYLHGKKGTLYWRARPSVGHVEAERANKKLGLSAHPAGWSARARFRISDLPVRWATLEARDAQDQEAAA